jgi:hypothetical protein
MNTMAQQSVPLSVALTELPHRKSTDTERARAADGARNGSPACRP